MLTEKCFAKKCVNTYSASCIEGKIMKVKRDELLISVIVPVYNIQEYLEQCIESIINQSHTYLQIILVDDGSQDDSGNICDSFALRDERIQVIHKKNGGLVSARKAGLAIAKGEYVGFVDGDDYVEYNFIETLRELIIQSNSDFVHTGYICENGKNMSVLPTEEGVYNLQDKERKVLRNYLEGKITITSSIWSKLFKRDFIKQCYDMVPNSQSIGEDLVCLGVCLLKGTRMAVSQESLYHYNVRQGSLMNRGRVYNAIELAICCSVLKEIFINNSVYNVLKDEFDSFSARQVLIIYKSIPHLATYVSLYCFDGIEAIRGRKIVLYGAGKVGQDYYTQISKYADCNIVEWLDGNPSRYHFAYREVKGINILDELQFDFVVIAVKSTEAAMQIKRELAECGISEDKLLWSEPKVVI